MSDQPHYPYRDGDRAVLGPDVTATPDGMTITWQGANYRRDHGEIQRYADLLAAVRDLRDDLRGITGARYIADALDEILDGAAQPAPAATGDVEATLARVRAAITILETEMATAQQAGHEQAAYALEGAALRILAALDQDQER